MNAIYIDKFTFQKKNDNNNECKSNRNIRKHINEMVANQYCCTYLSLKI